MENVAVRILEPGRPEVAENVDVALARPASEIVVLERDAGVPQRLDDRFELAAHPPGRGSRLVGAGILRAVDDDLRVAGL